jgi:hypothetical protein
VSTMARALLLATAALLGASVATQAQTWPPSACHAAVVTKLMMESFADGSCPNHQLTARGREMHQLAGRVVEFTPDGNGRSECLREGQRKYEAAVEELGAKLDHDPSRDGPRQCRVVEQFLDELKETIPGGAYYERK